MSATGSSAAPLSQDKLISLDLHEVGVERFIDEVKRQTDYRFMYNSDLVRHAGRVSVSVREKALGEVLNSVLGGVNLDYEMVDDVILIKGRSSSAQQPPQSQPQRLKTVTGRVTDSTGKPLAGMVVKVKGAKGGVQTDAEGRYSIDAAPTDAVLVFSCLGKVTREVAYTGQKTIDITMQDLKSEMDEVVVTGYFNVDKESYTGVATSFTGEQLRTISTGNILSTLSVLDPSFVQVENNEMGSDPNYIPEFEIRGAGSLKSIYSDSPNMPTFIMDGFEVTARMVFDFDPNRVKRITILKDAAATAIYGSRAANGVVVIETKTPEIGDLRLSYSGNANIEVADLSVYNLMNAREKLQYEVQAGLFHSPNNPASTDEKLLEYNNRLRLVAEGNDVNWLRIPVRAFALAQRHTVGLEGGNSAMRYGLDISYSHHPGIMKGSCRDNYGGGVRLQYNKNKLRFTNYTSFDFTKAVDSPYGSFSAFLNSNPYYNPYDELGNLKTVLYEYRYRHPSGNRTKTMPNWLWNATLPGKHQSTSRRFVNNFSVEYNLTQSFRIRSSFSLSLENGRTDNYISWEDLSFIAREHRGSYELKQNERFTYDFNTVATYFRNFGKHLINTGLILTAREESSDMTRIKVLGYQNAYMDHVSMGTAYDGGKPDGDYEIRRLAGLTGNLNYAFDSRYLLDFTLRIDGSSVFGQNNPWNKSWSAGLGWNLHNEEFLKDSRTVTMLKLRGSIGTTGGQRFNPFQSMAMYSYLDGRIKNTSYLDRHGVLLIAFGNKNLKWQAVEKQNVGFDFELFRRVSGSFNVYRELSRNLLLAVTIAPSLGFDSYTENLGKVMNTGFDLAVRTIIIKPKREDGLHWSVSVNMAHNKNELVEINEALKAYNEKQDSEVKSKPTIRYKEGQSQNTIWAAESLGIDPATGNEIYLDLDGNKTDEWSPSIYKPFHTSDPSIYGTVSTSLSYRGWEVNAYLGYRYGGYVYNHTLVGKVENVDPNENGDRRILYDRWKKPGDVAQYRKIPATTTTTNPTSRFVEKNNSVSMRSLSLSYNMDRALAKRLGLGRVRISAITNELFTISTVRMERGTFFPFTRTYSISAQITL